MSKTLKTTGSDALSNFKALEERVKQVVQVVRETRKEKEGLAEKLRQARTQIEALESEVRELQKDRKMARTRVQELIRQISAVERATLKDKEERVV